MSTNKRSTWIILDCVICDDLIYNGEEYEGRKKVCEICRIKAEKFAKELNQDYDEYIDSLLVTKELAGMLPQYKHDLDWN